MEKIYGYLDNTARTPVVVEFDVLTGDECIVLNRARPTPERMTLDEVKEFIKSYYQDVEKIVSTWREFGLERVRLQTILNNIVCPGITFQLGWIEDRFVLETYLRTMDTTTGKWGKVATATLLAYIVDADCLLRVARDSARYLQEHEMDEKFQYKGMPVFDPHKSLLGQK